MLAERTPNRKVSTVSRRKVCAGIAAATLIPASAASAHPPVPEKVAAQLPPDQTGDRYVSLSEEVRTGVRGPFSARALFHGPDEFPTLRECLELQRRFPERVNIRISDVSRAMCMHRDSPNVWTFTYPAADGIALGWKTAEDVPAGVRVRTELPTTRRQAA